MNRRKVIGAAVVSVAAGAAIAIAPTSAHASNDVVCDAAGNVFVSHPSAHQIGLSVRGLGRCVGGDQHGPYIVAFTGTGSATTIGTCQDLLPLVTQLDVPVRMKLQSVTESWYSQTYNVTFRLAVSTFPRLTAYTVVGSAGHLLGAGEIVSTKTACEGDTNSSGALFDWAFVNGLPAV